MTLKFYGDHASGSQRRILAAADYMGLEYEEVFLDLFKGEQRDPAFLALNPFGQVPVLVDGDTVIYEASAINIYLADKFGTDLLPAEGPQRYEVLQWMFWSGEHWRQYSVMLFNERIGKKIQGQGEEARMVDFIYENIRKSAEVLDAHLSTRKYMVGGKVSLADFDIAAPFSQITRTKLPYDEFPNIMAWQQRMLDEIPAWKATRDRLNARMDEAMEVFGVTF
jgi:glutathione S-transferase